MLSVRLLKRMATTDTSTAGDPQVIPDHASKDPSNNVANAKEGIDKADEYLDIPKLMGPEDLTNPKVDDLRYFWLLARMLNNSAAS